MTLLKFNNSVRISEIDYYAPFQPTPQKTTKPPGGSFVRITTLKKFEYRE
jgi:hypothetical protein